MLFKYYPVMACILTILMCESLSFYLNDLKVQCYVIIIIFKYSVLIITIIFVSRYITILK